MPLARIGLKTKQKTKINDVACSSVLIDIHFVNTSTYNSIKNSSLMNCGRLPYGPNDNVISCAVDNITSETLYEAANSKYVS